MQVNFDGEFIRIEERNSDLYASIDLALDKVERQIRKQKEKRSDRSKKSLFKEKFIDIFTKTPEVENQDEITKTMYYELKPLSVEDAKLKLEETGDMFLVFVDSIRGTV